MPILIYSHEVQTGYMMTNLEDTVSVRSSGGSSGYHAQFCMAYNMGVSGMLAVILQLSGADKSVPLDITH